MNVRVLNIREHNCSTNMRQFSLRTTGTEGFFCCILSQTCPSLAGKCIDALRCVSGVAQWLARLHGVIRKGLKNKGGPSMCGFRVFMWCGQCKTDNLWNQSGRNFVFPTLALCLVAIKTKMRCKHL